MKTWPFYFLPKCKNIRELTTSNINDNNIKHVLAGINHSSKGIMAINPIIGSPIKILNIKVTIADKTDPYLLMWFFRNTEAKNCGNTMTYPKSPERTQSP